MLTHLKHMLQLLSLPGDDLLRHYPNGSCKSCEMALDYENWAGVVLGQDEAELTREQRLKVIELNTHFSSFSGQRNAALWTDDAVRHAPEWTKVRRLTAEALEHFGWDPVPPPTEWIAKFIAGH